MIACQRFLRTHYCAHRRNLHLNLKSTRVFEKYSSHRGWYLYSVPQKNLSKYSYNQSSHQTNTIVPLRNDIYTLDELSRFISPNFNYKDVLYQNVEDINIIKLKDCRLASDVLKFNDESEFLTTEQLVQSVVTLRGFQKLLENYLDNSSEFISNQRDFEAALESPSFDKLVEFVANHSSKMNLEELSCCLLYLHKLHVCKEKLMPLVSSFENILENLDEKDITELALVRICSVFRSFNDLKSYNHLNNLLPIVSRKLDVCSDFETLGKLTICFQKMIPILGINSVKVFLEKSRGLLQQSEDPKIERIKAQTLIKVLLLICLKPWQNEFSSYEKELLSAVCGRVKYLNAIEMAILYDIVLENMKSHKLVHEIEQTFNNFLSHPTIQDDSRKLYIQSFFPKLKCSEQMSKKMFEFYSEKPLIINELYVDMNYFYRWLFIVDGIHLKECSDIYWNRVIDYFQKFSSSIFVDKVVWICLRYLNYHQGKHYYNGKFERLMLKYLSDFFLNESNCTLTPKDYVEIGLITIFFQRSLVNFTDPVWDRIVNNISRLKCHENMTISYILKMLLKRLQRTEHFPKFLPRYMNILAALNNNSMEHLSHPGCVNFEVINSILRAFAYRELVKTSPLFDLICERLKEIPFENMELKYVRDCVINMMHCSHLEPQLTDAMVAQIVTVKENWHHSLLTLLLNYTFTFGYIPEKSEELVDVVKKITIENKDNISRTSLIRTALALCFYHDLSAELTDYIFNVEFFNRLDREIENAVKNNYVKNIHINLMELNRAVCIEYPERDIPWFHEKLCKEMKTFEKRSDDYFFEDVSQKLKQVIPINNSVKFHCISPYFHKIDFLIHTNRKGEPVDPDSCAPSNLRKLAVLLNRHSLPSHYYKGRGRFELSKRQLELLDYKVILIHKKIWNSMYMSEPFAKENYLCSLIWPQ